MRILLAAKHPPGGQLPIGGVQTWISTVASELKRRGHDPHIWGPEWPLPVGQFDLGIFANTKYTHQALRLCERTLVISHGIIPDEEPMHGDVQAFTSEEVRAHWMRTGPVIAQPIDLGFWTPDTRPRTMLVRSSYRAGLDFLPDIACQLGLGFYHARNVTAVRLRELYRSAACVVATGRAAVEAMSCGAPVVICDDRPYQGPLLDCDTAGAMKRNYSGRGGEAPTQESLETTINAAIRQPALRGHVEQYHDARKIVGEILCYTC